MRHLIFLMTVLLVFPFFIQAQEDDNYVMYRTIRITPDYEDMEGLGEAMANHNKKYHSEDPHRANVYSITSGPDVGKMVWVLGPTMFRNFDEDPMEGHGLDWRSNVMAHVETLEHGEYWDMDLELSTVAAVGPDRPPYKILFIRYNKIRDGQSYQMKDFYGKVSSVMKKLDRPWGLFYNMFQQGDIGRHVASISYFNTWADFDKDWSFRNAYEELYGAGSWTAFMDQVNTIFEDTWDEMWMHVPELSGGQ